MSVPRCPRCSLAVHVASLTSDAWWCRQCGVVFPVSKEDQVSKDQEGKATDKEIPPVVQGLIMAFSDLLQAGTRLLNAKASEHEQLVKGMRGGKE